MIHILNQLNLFIAFLIIKNIFPFLETILILNIITILYLIMVFVLKNFVLN